MTWLAVAMILLESYFPQPLAKDQAVRLTFKYAGPVMFNAGNDLLYVGARGTWYPNAGTHVFKF